MTTAVDVAAAAKTWIDTRYHNQACIKGVGVDCFYLVVGVARELGLSAEFDQREHEFKGYKRPDSVVLLRGSDEFMTRIPIAQAGIGDVYVMTFETDPTHFAIISNADPIRIIHAYAQVRKVVEHGVDATWKARIKRAYRFKGLE